MDPGRPVTSKQPRLPRWPHLLAGGAELEQLLDELAPVPALDDEVDAVLTAVLSEDLVECRSLDPGARFRFAMGRSMEQLRGRVPGRALAEVLRPRL